MKKVFLLSLTFVVISAKFPNNVKKCSYGDSQCLIESSQEVLRAAGNGFPGLNLIPLDPLHVDKVDIRQNTDSPVNINLFFRDIILKGLSQLKVYKMQGFEQNPRKIEMRAKLDKLVLNANYKAKGRILLLPINGEGKCNLTFDNWDAGWRFTVNKVQKNGKEYVKVDNSKLFFNTTRLHMDFENLFNGDKALSDNMNQFLDQNWNVILTELKPSLTEAISQILQNVVSGPFAKIPYSELFNDPSTSTN
uniref:Putative hemolymph juvenile hormone binding protein n=1 Tax=Nyssomyia neivai TaxID=330878 RepID=A0A1L8DPW8_9DIPT